MNPNDSRFQTVVLLHDREDEPDGHVGEIAKILQESHPLVRFIIPVIPVTADSKNSFHVAAVKLFPLIPPRSLVIGIGTSGLFACALQEKFPLLDLSVFAINPPTYQDDLEVGMETGWSAQAMRVVLYSSQYEPLKRYLPDGWNRYADFAFDCPWLANGIGKAVYATSYLISAFMRGLDLKQEIATFLPPQKDQAQSEAAGI